jgi:triosephosphate isomerase
MRKKIVAGNWKMNLLHHEALELITDIVNLVDNENNVQIVLAPSFPYLKEAVEITNSHRQIKISAQNCADKENGAYTGEVSVPMLNSIGVEYVIIGHSERRIIYGETNSTIKRKLDLVLGNSLVPILCVGETLEERKSSKHFEIIATQILECSQHLNSDLLSKIIIAYEPVWAIGTGVTATPAQAQEMHYYIRNFIAINSTQEIADNITILYGGSCNEKNASELFSCKDIDGGLIGGASINAESFNKIISTLNK